MKPSGHPTILLAVLILAAMCTANLALRACAQAAQNAAVQQGGANRSFRVGDIVQADFFGTGHWVKGRIVQVYPARGPASQYTVEDASTPGARGAEAQVAPGSVRSWADADAQPTQPTQPISRAPSFPGQNPAVQQGGANGSFRVGDIVQADFFGTGHWVKGRIAQVYPAQGPVSQYTVEDASTPGARGAEAQLAPGSVRPWADAGAQPTQPAQPAWRAPAVPPAQPARPVQAVNPATTPGQPGQFKVGDRVLTSINSATGDYQPCTIMGPLSQGVYPVRCDPYKGRQYTDFGAFPEFIKPWPGAAPAPKVQACSFSVPAGTVTRNSPPTAQTFQRVIYNMAAVANDGPWGMTFTRFDIGTPFRNGVISNGMGGVEMAHRNAPQGGIIYPITSEYVRCINLDASYDERTIVDVNWACMKNNDGDWDCPTYSTAQVIKRERVPR